MDRIVTTRGNMPIKSSGAQSFINTAHFNALTKELAMLVSTTLYGLPVIRVNPKLNNCV